MNLRIKELRKALDMKQSQFAEKLNLATNYISLIESGKNPVNDKLIFNIVNKFNVNEAWLRTGNGEMFRELSREEELAEITAKMFNGEIPEEIQALMRVCVDMNEEEMKVISKFARKYVDEVKNLPE